MDDTHMPDAFDAPTAPPVSNPRITNSTTPSALNNPFATPKKPTTYEAPLTLQDHIAAMPKSWFFEIYEDAPGADTAEHIVNTPDSDSNINFVGGNGNSNGICKASEEGNKENVRPIDYQALEKNGMFWEERGRDGGLGEGEREGREVLGSVGNLGDDEVVFQ